MISWTCWRSPPCLTAAIRRFSVAMNGRYSETNRATIFSFTCNPFVTFCISRRMPSQARNASGSEMRRFAESSSVRSSHCVDAVMGAFIASAMI